MAKVLDSDRSNVGTIDLPQVFLTPYHPAVIHKTVSLLSHSFQFVAVYPLAGEIVSAESRNTGLGIARIARLRVRFSPRWSLRKCRVRHGRVAHPPPHLGKYTKKIT